MKPIILKLTLISLLLMVTYPSKAYDFEVDNIYYTITSLTDLTVEVSGNAYKGEYEISIPSQVEYKEKTLTVTGIGNNAFDGDTIRACTLPSSLLYIGNEAFKSCKINTVTIPSSVRKLGSGVFSYSTISEIQIPDSIISLPNSCFAYCKNLKNVILPDNLQSFGNYAFAYSEYSNLSFPNQLISMGSYAIAGCNLQNINLPSSLKTLETGCLSNNPFESIKVPQNVTSLPDYCFDSCSNLYKIEFPSNLLSIGDYAFKDCKNLVHLDLPEFISFFGENIFNGCDNLKVVNIPNGIKSIDANLFWSTPLLETISFGSSLTGLPFDYSYETDRNKYTKSVSDLGNHYYHYYNPYNWGPTIDYETYDSYLENLKEVIIENSPNEFSIKGFYANQTTIPAFCHNYNSTIEYFYLGRPLKDTRIFDNGRLIEVAQGYGKIKKLEISGYCKNVPYFYQEIDTLVLGFNISYIDWDNIYTAKLKVITCENITPPSSVRYISKFTTQQYTDIPLYIPYGTKETYQKAEFWQNFWNIVELPPVLPEEIILSLNEIQLYVSESEELSASVMPENTYDKTITWSSEDSSIASVSQDGIITAISTGTVNIIVACGDISSICKVTVLPKEVQLDVTQAEIEIGSTLQLNALLLPDNTSENLKWKSSNESVAKVDDNGMVTALSKGTATIKASSQGASASCEITVKRLPVEWIEIDYPEVDLETKWTIRAYLHPTASGGTKFEWSKSNNLLKIDEWSWTDEFKTCSIVTLSRRGTESGVCEVTVTAGDASATCVVNVLPDAGVESLLANPEIETSIYSTDGILIKKDCKVEDLKTLNKGIYIIVSGKEHYKISI